MPGRPQRVLTAKMQSVFDALVGLRFGLMSREYAQLRTAVTITTL